MLTAFFLYDIRSMCHSLVHPRLVELICIIRLAHAFENFQFADWRNYFSSPACLFRVTHSNFYKLIISHAALNWNIGSPTPNDKIKIFYLGKYTFLKNGRVRLGAARMSNCLFSWKNQKLKINNAWANLLMRISISSINLGVSYIRHLSIANVNAIMIFLIFKRRIWAGFN